MNLCIFIDGFMSTCMFVCVCVICVAVVGIYLCIIIMSKILHVLNCQQDKKVTSLERKRCVCLGYWAVA